MMRISKMVAEEENTVLETGDHSRREWIVPAVSVIRAGEAEAGPNPVTAEGPFGTGS